MFKDNEFLKTVLGLFGVPDIAFDFADPVAVLFAVIFSEQIFIFFLSIVIWLAVKFFSSGVGNKPTEFMDKKRDDLDVSTYQYSDISDMKNMYKSDKTPGFFSVVFKGFLLPVLVIFIAITIAMEFAYG